MLPAPIRNADNAPYWDAAREEKLVLQRCRKCHTYRALPSYLCQACGHDESEWTEVDGAGQVATFSIVHRAPTPEFREHVPYVVALIDLDVGARMMSNIVGDDALATRIGDRVQVCFEARGGDGDRVPQFSRVRP